MRTEFEIAEDTRAFGEGAPEGILIRPVTRKIIRNLRGSLKDRGVLKALTEDRQVEREW